MGLAFRRNHWVLAGSHGNQDFLGSSLPVPMWRFEKFIPKSLAAQNPQRDILASGHSSKSRKDAAPSEMFKLERRICGRGGQSWKRAVQCYGDLHSMFAPGSVNQDLPTALTKLNPPSHPSLPIVGNSHRAPAGSSQVKINCKMSPGIV